jgi:hypothetical protein
MRDHFIQTVIERLPTPVVVDYVRLDIYDAVASLPVRRSA